MLPFAIETLRETGYLCDDNTPAQGFMLSASASTSAAEATRLGPLLSETPGGLRADAVFRVGTSPVILFKSAQHHSDDELTWHRTAWNFGVAPLLWVTTPEYIRLYNAYQPPEEYSRKSPLLKEFPLGDLFRGSHTEAQQVCSRRHFAMGSFWKSPIARSINRQSRIDNVLLQELGHLLTALHQQDLRPELAQKLVGRCIFFQYLVHREYLNEQELNKHFGAPSLHQILTNLDKTYEVFRWIKSTFNGDLFPIEDEDSELHQLDHTHERLAPLADFFGNFNIADGQGRLFPFRFDAIPVELISSIYEKFTRMAASDDSPRFGVHYTPTNLVDLVLDPVFEDLSPETTVLDTACGSGVFLVESLRRLVWLQSQNKQVTRELIGDILKNQIRGVDISPAALSVASFSLYLALLELDPSPPRGIEALRCLEFEPLMDRVLFPCSAFEEGLEDKLRDASSAEGFDVIVGNPPWTYNPTERSADRELAKENGDHGEKRDDEMAGGSSRSGTTYAREKGLPIPARSPDWPFLWRCRDFAHSTTRVALVMKATPFFSQAPATVEARESLLRAFPNIALVNLSQLRTSRLFQEYEQQKAGKKQRRRPAGPALLFLSNCLPTDAGCVSVMDFPWSPTFRRTGVFQLPTETPKSVNLETLTLLPGLLKASTYGTERDAWFLERLSRNSALCTLGSWLKRAGLPNGKGYQPGDAMDAAHLRGLPRADCNDIKYSRFRGHLQPFDDDRVHRARDPSIFRGPLLLFPEGSLTDAPIRGRYTVVYDKRDIAFNFSFFGVSFFDRNPTWARALAAIMHSRLVAYQLAYVGGTVGIKQTKVEVPDITSVRIPYIEDFDDAELEELSSALDALVGKPQSPDSLRAAQMIDKIVEATTGLKKTDLQLLLDTERRTNAVFFETPASRSPMHAPPDGSEIETYTANVCEIFNGFSSYDEDCILVPGLYSILSNDLVIVKLMLTQIRKGADQHIPSSFSQVPLREVGNYFMQELGGLELPYLKPAKTLRLYAENEVYILKPAHYRCFTPAAGQTDGDRIVADLMQFPTPAHKPLGL